ncbi:MAG: ATP-binding cassette domain-containing protein [Pseudobdellovibrionaceae bacterium]
MEDPKNDVICTQGLTRFFDHTIAVDHINLEVHKSEIFGLLGPNGAGKTTTIKMLTTLTAPTSGEAWVAGFNVRKEPAKVRQHIGYVSQMLSTDGSLTGIENLELSAKLNGVKRQERKKRILQALSFMGLSEAETRLAKTYSGGMVRRLEIAQAMLHRPTLLFLDEPTVGLDPLARHAVWDRLMSLRSEFGMSVLITTHDMEEADHLCDRIAIMLKGKIATVGTPQALKETIGPEATLDDVFIKFSGSSMNEGGNFSDVKQVRSHAHRLS